MWRPRCLVRQPNSLSTGRRNNYFEVSPHTWSLPLNIASWSQYLPSNLHKMWLMEVIQVGLGRISRVSDLTEGILYKWRDGCSRAAQSANLCTGEYHGGSWFKWPYSSVPGLKFKGTRKFEVLLMHTSHTEWYAKIWIQAESCTIENESFFVLFFVLRFYPGQRNENQKLFAN